MSRSCRFRFRCPILTPLDRTLIKSDRHDPTMASEYVDPFVKQGFDGDRPDVVGEVARNVGWEKRSIYKSIYKSILVHWIGFRWIYTWIYLVHVGAWNLVCMVMFDMMCMGIRPTSSLYVQFWAYPTKHPVQEALLWVIIIMITLLNIAWV